jgi:hypothetical protein
VSVSPATKASQQVLRDLKAALLKEPLRTRDYELLGGDG